MLFDCVVLTGIHFVFLTTNHLLVIIPLWALSNLLNYPRVVGRRYISHYKLLGLTVRQVFTFFILYGLGYAIFNTRMSWPGFWETLPILLLLLSRLLFVFFLRLYRIKGKGYNRFLVIGNTPVMDQLANRFIAKKSYGHILEGKLERFTHEPVQEMILNSGLNEIYCSSRCVTQDDISKLLSFSFQYGINVHVVSDNSAEEQEGASFESMDLEYAELDLQSYPLVDQKNLIIKRLFDLLFSTIIIVTVLSWVTLILGLIIKLESKGPVFFIQPRAGRNGKYFMCLKFRSMRQESGLKQATKGDPRITKVGRIIRKLSLDELPQFINVFRGHMSVVGPRPHIKDLNDKYDSTISNYNDRVLVKPGITGLSQITGHRGETNGNASMANRIRIDILYLRSWTLYLDLVIIYKTVIDVLFFKSKNAY